MISDLDIELKMKISRVEKLENGKKNHYFFSK